MKCQSCQEVVSPKFKAALSSNLCPFCGDKIISEKLQEILAELQVIMKDAEEFPDEVADWFFADHQLKKIGSKQSADMDEDDGLTSFAKRAGIKSKPIKGAGKFKEVLEQIQLGDDEIESIEQREEVPQDYEDLTETGLGHEREMIMVDDGSVKKPLTGNDKSQLFDVFDNSGVSPVLENEKLKRMQRQYQGGGKVSRNED